MRRMNFLLIMIVIFLGCQCTVPLRELTYLYGIQSGFTNSGETLPATYRVQPHDLLYIQVNGEDPGTTDFLNLTGGSGNMMSSSTFDLISYEVNESGEISFSQLGKIKVAGSSVDEISEIIQAEVNKYIQNASVFVKLVDRTITVLGEVRNPGRQLMGRNKINIFEALGSAGDITDYGNRRNVKLVRESKEGTFVAFIDLTDPTLISSPNYYILPHDVIYVEPRTRIYGNKTMPFGSGITLAVSTMYSILLLITLLK
jgi:polysaccharide biosynthesis/export protein